MKKKKFHIAINNSTGALVLSHVCPTEATGLYISYQHDLHRGELTMGETLAKMPGSWISIIDERVS